MATPRRELTELARGLVPPLPFAVIDVLIIEHGGKDISGTTMDPNVTGRFWVHGLARPAPRPASATIVLLGITEASGGNVLGIGFADFIPASVAHGIDWQKTYVNCFTAGIAGVRRSRMPMVLPDRGRLHQGRAQHVRPRLSTSRSESCASVSTLHLTRCWVSDAAADATPPWRRDRRLASRLSGIEVGRVRSAVSVKPSATSADP